MYRICCLKTGDYLGLTTVPSGVSLTSKPCFSISALISSLLEKSLFFLASSLSVIKDDLYSVLISQSDMSEGTLIRPSRIRPDKIFNVEKKLVKMRVGSVKHAVFDKVRQEVVKIMN
jgi:hypothetical protein